MIKQENVNQICDMLENIHYYCMKQEFCRNCIFCDNDLKCLFFRYATSMGF